MVTTTEMMSSCRRACLAEAMAMVPLWWLLMHTQQLAVTDDCLPAAAPVLVSALRGMLVMGDVHFSLVWRCTRGDESWARLLYIMFCMESSVAKLVLVYRDVPQCALGWAGLLVKHLAGVANIALVIFILYVMRNLTPIADPSDPSAPTSPTGSDKGVDHVMPSTWTLEAGENPETCAICLETPAQGDVVSKLDCGHVFHAECVSKWMSSGGLCPFRCPATSRPAESAV